MRIIHPLSPDSKVNRPLVLKLLSLLILGIIGSPIPRMIAFSNPTEADVLGRYTYLFFGILVSYLGLALSWLVITVWVLTWLTPARLNRVREFMAERPRWLAGSFFLPLAILLLFRVSYLLDLVHLPEVLDPSFQRLPALVGIIWIAAFIFLVDEKDLERFGSFLPSVQSRRMLPWLALGIVWVIHLALVLDIRTWEFPLGFDNSTHIYLGQHWLRGGIPYQTVYYSHPPVRFVISGLWAAVAQLLGISVVYVARAYEILISLGVFAAIYAVGEKLTERAWGGALSASILLGTELILELTIYGPTFRLSIVLLTLLGIWFTQKERFLWGGLFASLAVLAWMPALTVLLAILATAVLQQKVPRGKSALSILAGVGIVLALVALPLAAIGALQNAIRQNVLSVLLVAIPKYVFQSTFSPSRGIFERLGIYVQAFGFMLRGDWELITLMVLGFVAMPLAGRQLFIEGPARLVVWLSAVLMIGATWLEFDATARDAIMLIAMFVPLGAGLITDVLDGLFATPGTKRYSPFFAGILSFTLILVGGADALQHRAFLYSLTPLSLSDEREMVAELDSRLAADDTIQSTGGMWIQVLSNRDNATPFLQFGPEASDSLKAMNLSDTDFVQQIAEVKPVIIMLRHGLDDQLAADLGTLGYERIGNIHLDITRFSHKIFVRRDRPDLRAVIEGWPLIAP